MNVKLPILASLAAVLLVAVTAGQLRKPVFSITTQKPSATPKDGGRASKDSPPVPILDAGQPPQGPHANSPPSGDQLIADAAAAMLRQGTISAKIRQKIELFGHSLVGSGSYQQLRTESDLQLRLELKIRVADRISNLQHISDGRHLWIRNDLGKSVRLARVDLREVREALEDANSSAVAPASTAWLTQGGLPKLMEGLKDNFQFDAPQASQLSDVPVWIVRGTWRPARLACLLPAKKEALLAGQLPAADEWPEHLPAIVSVALSRDELFPHRLQFLQPVTVENKPGGTSQIPTERTIVSMDLFEVQLAAPIDPLHFAYDPGSQEWTDRTDEYVKQVRRE